MILHDFAWFHSSPLDFTVCAYYRASLTKYCKTLIKNRVSHERKNSHLLRVEAPRYKKFIIMPTVSFRILLSSGIRFRHLASPKNTSRPCVLQSNDNGFTRPSLLSPFDSFPAIPYISNGLSHFVRNDSGKTIPRKTMKAATSEEIGTNIYSPLSALAASGATARLCEWRSDPFLYKRGE